MQVTENKADGLKRELQITVGAKELENRLLNRLNELKAQVRIPGFRPGKVPVDHLRRVHGPAVMADIIQEAVNETSQKALEERKERPATQPQISLAEETGEMESLVAGKTDLAFTMSFEVVPNFEVMDFSKLKLERPVAPVEETQVAESLDTIAGQQRDFAPRDGKAENGDRVMIDFIGRVGGEAFEGGTAQDAPLELGSNSFIPGFEEQLIGAKAGDDVTVKVRFPENYQAEELAGAEAEFEVKVKEVAAPKPVTIDDEFAKRLGIDSLDKLRETVREQIAKEHERVTNERLKRQVLDAIDKAHSFDLPEALVAQEFDLIWNQVGQEMERTGTNFADEGTTEDEARDEYRGIAERRVRLGLVLGEVGREAKVEIGDEEIQEALMQRVRQFPGQEREVYEFYQKNPNAIADLRGPIFEAKSVAHILTLASLSDKTVSREELFADPDEDEDEKPARGKAKSGAKAAKKPARKAPAKKAGTDAKKPAKKKSG